jgi:hypothetical protein
LLFTQLIFKADQQDVFCRLSPEAFGRWDLLLPGFIHQTKRQLDLNS